MLNNIKEILRDKASGPYRATKMLRDQIFFHDSHLHTTGYYRSSSELKPCRPDGSPIPWMNYPVVKVLENALKQVKDINLFEYGSGSSTIFFSTHASKVVSCEHDRGWYEKLKEDLPENVEIMYRAEDTDGAYCRAIADTDNRFDVVIVDGRDRPNCIMQALNHLTERGVIVLDDSHREGYQSVLEHVRGLGFRVLEIEGLKPLVKKTHSTALCYRDNNCLGI